MPGLPQLLALAHRCSLPLSVGSDLHFPPIPIFWPFLLHSLTVHDTVLGAMEKSGTCDCRLYPQGPSHALFEVKSPSNHSAEPERDGEIRHVWGWGWGWGMKSLEFRREKIFAQPPRRKE